MNTYFTPTTPPANGQPVAEAERENNLQEAAANFLLQYLGKTDGEMPVLPPQADPLPDPYIPSVKNRPPKSEAVLKFAGRRIGSTGNMTTLVAKPGAGKSAVCEAITAAWLNPETDNFNLEVNLPEDKTVLYFDGERSKEDVYYSFIRIIKRSGMHYVYDTNNELQIITDDERRRRLMLGNIIQGHSTVSNFKHRKLIVERTIKAQNVGLLILDGYADFVTDVNNATETTELHSWMNELCQRYNMCIFGTLHLNPGVSMKPRGHTGSEMMRRSEGVLLLEENADGIRHLTTNWEHGKVRNDAKDSEGYFRWDDEQKMFLSCDYTESESFMPKFDIVRDLTPFLMQEQYTTAEITDEIIKMTECSKRTAHNYLKELTNAGVLAQQKRGVYIRQPIKS